MKNPVVEVMKRACPKVIGPLLRMIEENLGKDEILEAYEWLGNAWYLVVKNTALKPKAGEVSAYPHNSMIGWTVDISKDKIFWSNATKPLATDAAFPLTNGGNCFVRSNKWKHLLKNAGVSDLKGKFHWYMA